MTELIGTEKRPVFWIQEEMQGRGDLRVSWAQISANGLWLEFYTEDLVFVFKFPIMAVESLVRTWKEKS